MKEIKFYDKFMDAYETCTEVELEMHKKTKSTNHPNINNLYQILNELHLLINCEEYYVVDLIEILLDYDVALEDKMRVAIMTGFDTYNLYKNQLDTFARGIFSNINNNSPEEIRCL